MSVAVAQPAPPTKRRRAARAAPAQSTVLVETPASTPDEAPPAAAADASPEVIHNFAPEDVELWHELDIRVHSRTPEAVEDLRTSIRQLGVKQPVRAQLRPGMKPRVFMGFTRSIACAQLAMVVARRAQRGDIARNYYDADPLARRAREEVRAQLKPEKDALLAAVLAAPARRPIPGGGGGGTSDAAMADTPAEPVAPRGAAEVRSELEGRLEELRTQLDTPWGRHDLKRPAVAEMIRLVTEWAELHDLGPMSDGKTGMSVNEALLVERAQAYVDGDDDAALPGGRPAALEPAG